jgi:hypothetical protein
MRWGRGLCWGDEIDPNLPVNASRLSVCNAAFAGSRDRRLSGWPVRLLCWDIVYIRTVLLSQARARQTAHSSLSDEYRLFRSIPRGLGIAFAHMVQLD